MVADGAIVCPAGVLQENQLGKPQVENRELKTHRVENT